MNPNAKACWVAGYSFGAWIGMQLLMRRPEIDGFISVAPPANHYDFGFLAPCPSSGLIYHGDEDELVPRKLGEEAGRQAEPSAASPSTTACCPGAGHVFTPEETEKVVNAPRTM